MAVGRQSIDFSAIERSEIRLAIRAALTGCSIEARGPLTRAYQKLAAADGFTECPPGTFETIGDVAARVIERAAGLVGAASSVLDDEARHLATAAASLDSKISSLGNRERLASR